MSADGRRVALAALVVVALALLLFTYRLGDTPLVDPDEGRYATSSARMLETGDWLVPWLAGEPRLNKPPLFYWLQASAMAVLGPGEAAARAPSVAALLLVIAALLTTGRLHGVPRAGVLAALVAATAMVSFGAFHLGTTDAVMTALLAVAFLLGLATHERRLAPWPGTILTACALGLAVLAKGHVPIAVFLAVELVFRLLSPVRVRPAAGRVLVGAGLIALISVPWVAGVVLRVGWGPLLETLTGEAARLHEGGDHPEAWYYYLLRYPLLLLPWTGFFLVALVHGWRRRREPLLGFALAWSLAPMVLFSLSSGKNPLYLLPAVPGAALLVGLAWAGRGARCALRARGRLVAAGGITALLLLAGTTFLVLHYSSRRILGDHRVAAFALAAAMALLILFMAWRRRGVVLAGLLALFSSALFLVGMHLAPGIIGWNRSTLALAEAYRADAGPEDAAAFYRADALQHPSFLFYGGPADTLWRSRELRARRREPGRLYMVCGEDDHARLRAPERQHWEGPLARVRELALFREVEPDATWQPGVNPPPPAGD